MKKEQAGKGALSATELRSARSERIEVRELSGGGYVASSELNPSEPYLIYTEPKEKRLTCTCGDYVFRGNDDPAFECKHILAVLKFIGRKAVRTARHQ